MRGVSSAANLLVSPGSQGVAVWRRRPLRQKANSVGVWLEEGGNFTFYLGRSGEREEREKTKETFGVAQKMNDHDSWECGDGIDTFIGDDAGGGGGLSK